MANLGKMSKAPRQGAEQSAHVMQDSIVSPEALQLALQIADTGKQGEGIDQGRADRGSSTAGQGDPLAVLAAAVANLSPADRERLAAMLTGHQGGERGHKADREAQP
jgi:hypothetical protein